MLNENLNLAKSILRKSNKSENDPDFESIKSFVGDKRGYLGLITKLRYIDNIPVDELHDLFNSISELKLDASSLLKLSYSEISDIIYDGKVQSKSSNFKLQFSDGVYDYYRVFTYEGILDIGSPAWCIKTKSYWDKYTNNDPINNQQWVVIRKIGKKLLTPNTNYLTKYVNQSNPMIRIGITIQSNGKIYAFNDNDGQLQSIHYDKFLTQINKFNNGETITFSFEDLIRRESDISWQNNKIWNLTKDEFNRVHEYMSFPDMKYDGSMYLHTINNTFSKYIILQGNYHSFDNGYKRTDNPNPYNQKSIIEIIKQRSEKDLNIPISLVGIAIDLKSTTIDRILSKNSDLSTFKYNGDEFLSYTNENKNGKYIIAILTLKKWKEDSNTEMMYFIFDKDRTLKEVYLRDCCNLTSSDWNKAISHFGKDNISRLIDLCEINTKRDRKDNRKEKFNRIKKFLSFK